MTLVVRQGGLFVQLNYTSVQFILVPKLNQPKMIRVVQDKALCCTFKTSVCVYVSSPVCNADYPCEGMSRHATFENFGMAFLTLFQVSTGDNWNGIMKVPQLWTGWFFMSETSPMALLIGSDHVFVNIGAAAPLGHAWNWNGGHLKCLVIDKNVIIT